MRDENQCLHGRDAHAPLSFASHTLSSHFRISEGGQSERSAAARQPYHFLSSLPNLVNPENPVHPVWIFLQLAGEGFDVHAEDRGGGRLTGSELQSFDRN